MDFHRLKVIRFIESIVTPTKALSRKQCNEKKESVQKVIYVNNVTAKENKKLLNYNKSSSKSATLTCDNGKIKGTSTPRNHKPRNSTNRMNSISTILKSFGHRKRKARRLIDVKAQNIKVHSDKRNKLKLETFSEKYDLVNNNSNIKRNKLRNFKDIVTILAPKETKARATAKHHLATFDKTPNKHVCNTAFNKVNSQNQLFRTLANKFPRRKDSLECHKCYLTVNSPYQATNKVYAKSDNGGSCHYNVLRFPFKHKAKLRSKRSVPLYQITLENEDIGFSDRCLLEKPLSDTKLYLPVVQKIPKVESQVRHEYKYDGKAANKNQIEKISLEGGTLTDKQIRVMMTDNALPSLGRKAMARQATSLPRDDIIMANYGSPSTIEQMQTGIFNDKTLLPTDASKANSKREHKTKGISEGFGYRSLPIQFASKMYCKLRMIFSFFKQQRTTNRRILKLILFCIILVAWFPCIIVVGFSWGLLYVLKPQFLSNNKKRKQSKHDQGEIDKLFKSMRPNFSCWSKHFRNFNIHSGCENQVRQKSNKLTLSSKSLNQHPIRPNKEKKYTLFHVPDRGWVIKPIRDTKQRYYCEQTNQNDSRGSKQYAINRCTISNHTPNSLVPPLEKQRVSTEPCNTFAPGMRFTLWKPSISGCHLYSYKTSNDQHHCLRRARTGVFQIMSKEIPKILVNQHCSVIPLQCNKYSPKLPIKPHSLNRVREHNIKISNERNGLRCQGKKHRSHAQFSRPRVRVVKHKCRQSYSNLDINCNKMVQCNRKRRSHSEPRYLLRNSGPRDVCKNVQGIQSPKPKKCDFFNSGDQSQPWAKTNLPEKLLTKRLEFNQMSVNSLKRVRKTRGLVNPHGIKIRQNCDYKFRHDPYLRRYNSPGENIKSPQKILRLVKCGASYEPKRALIHGSRCSKVVKKKSCGRVNLCRGTPYPCRKQYRRKTQFLNLYKSLFNPYFTKLKSLWENINFSKLFYKPEVNFCDSLYVKILHKRPWFWIYRCCPQFYPYFLSCRSCCIRCNSIGLVCLAVCMWSPLFICGYLCYRACRMCLC